MKGGSREDGGWYDHGVKYWENIPATVDGVLGGFGHVSGIDVKARVRRARAHTRTRRPRAARRVASWTCGNVAPRAALTPHRAGATCRRARNSRRGMT